MSVLLGIACSPAALVPLFIFAAEVCVVTISTMRTIFVARGMKVLAPVLGFFEVSIWLFAIAEVMKNLSDWTCSAAFAGGFTLGNYLGICLEEKLAMGSVVVRIITCKDAAELVENLRAAGFGVTCLDGRGSRGPVQVLLTVVRRQGAGASAGPRATIRPGSFLLGGRLAVGGPGRGAGAAAGPPALSRPGMGAWDQPVAAGPGRGHTMKGRKSSQPSGRENCPATNQWPPTTRKQRTTFMSSARRAGVRAVDEQDGQDRPDGILPIGEHPGPLDGQVLDLGRGPGGVFPVADQAGSALARRQAFGLPTFDPLTGLLQRRDPGDEGGIHGAPCPAGLRGHTTLGRGRPPVNLPAARGGRSGPAPPGRPRAP